MSDIILEENLMVPMRDGVRLATDVFRPAAPGRYPVLLTRVPYDKSLESPHAPGRRVYLELNLDVARAVAQGFAVVAQDTRGRFASEGQFRPAADEAEDGADAVAWAAAQPWSSGAVGMFGESYQGLTQWAAAWERPAALRAIAPMHAPFGRSSLCPFRGGALQLATFLWVTLGPFSAPEARRLEARGLLPSGRADALEQAGEDPSALLRRLPVADQPLLEGVAPYFAEWLADPAGAAARQLAERRELYPRVTAPALLVGGWYDYFLDDTLAHYRGLRESGGSAAARRPLLVVGPWAHVDFPGMFAERDYGPHAGVRASDLPGLQLRFFERWLRSAAPAEGDPDEAMPVRIFVMGADEWRGEADWPPPDARALRLFLRGDGPANTAAGDGWLAPEPPGAEPPDRFTSDPRDPVPTVGGAVMLQLAPGAFSVGPMDQRAVEARADVLCYTTPPLERPLEVVGPVVLAVHVACDAADTDLCAKLVDVWPDGRAEILTDGILRARYRRSHAEPEPLEPGAVYELRVELGATANRFLAGHRLRLEVAGSSFPRYDRNPNTGGDIARAGEADLRPAQVQIFHDAARPSHLLLSVVERG